MSVRVSPACTPVGGILVRVAVEFLALLASPAIGVGSSARAFSKF